MYPRANALGIVIKGQYILLEEQEGENSYRPIGGTIEFGERSDETLVREFAEELGVDVVIHQYISCIENIFKADQSIGHEITQLYVVGFKDSSLYHQEQFTVSEGEKITITKWIPVEEIFSGEKVLYPTGLAERLANIV